MVAVMTPSEMLRTARVAAGLTQRRLAELGGTSQPKVSDYEAGRVVPSAAVLFRMVRACGQDIELSVRQADLSRREVAYDIELHRLVVTELVRAPDAVLAKARANLGRMRAVDLDGRTLPWLERWEVLLSRRGVELVEMLLATDQASVDLRQTSPFAGVLTDEQRQAALAASKHRPGRAA